MCMFPNDFFPNFQKLGSMESGGVPGEIEIPGITFEHRKHFFANCPLS